MKTMMTNEELATAIESTWTMLVKTNKTDEPYKAIESHFQELLKIQATRARMAEYESQYVPEISGGIQMVKGRQNGLI